MVVKRVSIIRVVLCLSLSLALHMLRVRCARKKTVLTFENFVFICAFGPIVCALCGVRCAMCTRLVFMLVIFYRQTTLIIGLFGFQY